MGLLWNLLKYEEQMYLNSNKLQKQIQFEEKKTLKEIKKHFQNSNVYITFPYFQL